jgi:hypothetical protein
LNLLDENFPEDQCVVLRGWGIPFRQIGVHLSHRGAKDDDIIPLLHRQRHVAFFTQDEDFYLPQFCHPAYCLVWLEVRADDLAHYLRCFLLHPRFDTASGRMGVVARAHHDGVHFWQRKRVALQHVHWPVGR